MFNIQIKHTTAAIHAAVSNSAVDKLLLLSIFFIKKKNCLWHSESNETIIWMKRIKK